MKKLLLVSSILVLALFGCKKANKAYVEQIPKDIELFNPEDPSAPISFLMGSAPDDPNIKDELRQFETQHTVFLKPFVMKNYPVTQEDYEALMGTNPSANNKGGKLPVENMTWLLAVKYANLLSDADGYEAAYTINGNTVTWDPSKNGWRLPTEAEWEYAGRGGTDTSFSWGNNPDPSKGNFKLGAAARGTTVDVGQYPANGYGLYDMSGNVFEYVWNQTTKAWNYSGSKPDLDKYEAQTGFDLGANSIDNPVGYGANPYTNDVTKLHITRGGSYMWETKDQRIARRDAAVDTGGNNKPVADVGFRLARNYE